MKWEACKTMALAVLVSVVGGRVLAQSASTGVHVGPGRAGATGSASGQFQHVDTDSRVGPNGSLARGLAVGAGPNGMAISHSIGVNGGGVGTGHNFNLSIGPGGVHTSGGAVNARGGSGSVHAGGHANAGGWGFNPSGGSSVGGIGRVVDARTHASTTPHFGARGLPSPGFGGPGGFSPPGLGRNNFGPSAGLGGPLGSGFPGRGPFGRFR
jgi:hypothetical protein